MKTVTVYKGEIEIADKIKIANTFFCRMFGLMPKKVLDENEGILLEPCKQVHTFHMKYAIDVVFLSKDNVILHIINALEPNKVTKYYKEVCNILELVSGKAQKNNLAVGDKLSFKLKES